MTRFPGALASLFLAFNVLLFGVASARALTIEDIAGLYQGNSVAKLSSGQTINAALTVKIRQNGVEKVTATVNGQTVVTKGTVQFVTDDIIVGVFPGDEYTAFVNLNGSSLVLTILTKENANGEFANEVTTLTLIQKL